MAKWESEGTRHKSPATVVHLSALHPYQPRGQGCPHSWGLRSGYRVCSQGSASRVTVTPSAFCPKLSQLIS